jgi:hypothetical protein
VSCEEALTRHKEQAAPAPEREQYAPIQDSIAFQLGYKLGWHHGMSDAVEIAEEADD